MERGLRLHGAARLPGKLAGGCSSSRSPLRTCVHCASQRDGACPGGRLQSQLPRSFGLRGTPALQPTESAGDDEIVGWNWTGSDEFSPLNDRKDAPPLSLPRLKASKRMVLVRHGQSTWNARNRIQGSSNFSVLTDLGIKQAAVAQQLLGGWDFQYMFYSPLKRAAQTSEIVWGRRRGLTLQLPCLREIDLYSFQGLDKIASRTLYTDQYQAWESSPADFLIDDHAPVRELWYRASLAWREMLLHKQLQTCGLVVAHNAVNQALLCTALGLPPAFFRRFAQSNAAFTVLDFQYSGTEGSQRAAATPQVRVERMNQFPDHPLNSSKLGKLVPNRLVLVCGEATLPAVQASLNMLASNRVTGPPLIGVGSTAQQTMDIKTAVRAALATPGDGRLVVAVASAEACQRLLGACLGGVEPAAAEAGQQQVQQVQQAQKHMLVQDEAEVGCRFRMSGGGITIVNWPPGQQEMHRGTVLCTNYQLPPA